MIQIPAVILSAWLFFWGGHSWNVARRYILPIMLAMVCAYLAHSFWSLTQLAAIGCFCMGYGEDSPLRRIFGNGWGRGIWGLLAGLSLSLGLFLTGHIAWYFFAGYLVLCFILENALKNLDQGIADPVIGAAFGLIALIVK